jgi:ATPases with chaperone activity, ATP-binding subunit
VGYDEGGQLTEAVRHKPYSVILLDEIEKAHPDVFNILLQVLEDGRLTDNKGRTVNFKNTIIIMTSNIGSQILQENIDRMNDSNRESLLEKARVEIMLLMKQTIRPEFLNRVDEIVMFAPLTKTEVKEIVRLQFKGICKMLDESGISAEITEDAINWIANESFDPHFGARPVKRVFQKYVLNELSKKILAGTVNKDNKIIIDSFGEGLSFHN